MTGHLLNMEDSLEYKTPWVPQCGNTIEFWFLMSPRRYLLISDVYSKEQTLSPLLPSAQGSWWVQRSPVMGDWP